MGPGKPAAENESWNAERELVLRKQCLNEDVEVAEPASLFNNVCCELSVEERGSFFLCE